MRKTLLILLFCFYLALHGGKYENQHITCLVLIHLCNSIDFFTVLGYENGPPISDEEKADAMKDPAANATVDPNTIPWGSVGNEDGVMDRNVWDTR